MNTATLAITVGSALLLLLVTVLGYLQLRQIHSAVNSNMTTALHKIEDLHARVAELVEERTRTNRKPAKRKPTRRKR